MNRLETIYHVAYLAGGPDRVTDTAVAGALERKAARLGSSGVLRRTSAKPADPFVLAAVESLPKVRIARVREVLRESEPMRALRAELLAGGLILPAVHWRRAWHAVTRREVWATKAGERMLFLARKDPSLVTGAAGAVALGSLGAHPDRRLARLLTLTPPSARDRAQVAVGKPPDGLTAVVDCSAG
ncbi:TIGR04222 domain-containing membrane protein [Amycolatopsis alba]|nr:TIGR04222 domain-containing membrane protein [Amycolatopsis alba]